MYMEMNAPSTKDRILTFLVPANKCHAALDSCHWEAGHQGRDRMLSLLRERFWWSRMGVQATLSLRNCKRCRSYETRPSLPKMVMIGATKPLDLVHMEFVGMETMIVTRKQPVVKTVLVLVDHFTQFVRAYIVEDCQATTVAKVLYDEYFSVFGFPHQLMSDNAPEFVGKVLMVLCNLLNVKQVRMSPYHPQSNGSVEQNLESKQTLIRMVGKLDHKRKSRWPDHISSICHTYNTTKSQVMGYSLHFLMFGRRPRLPIDLIFPMAHQEAVKGVDRYVSTLYEHLRRAISLACTAAHKEAQRFKRIYDKRADMIVLCPSNKVLTHLDTFMGTRRKLKNWWNSQLHMVVCHVVDGVPTYVVRNYNNRNESIFHRTRLLLWIAADTDGDDGVRSSPAITALGADGPVERDTMVECVVSQDVSYGLSLAVFKTMIGPSCHKTGCEARAPQSGMVP